MQVTASLTVSLRHRDRLWGLIACHHYSGPKHASAALRQACEISGDYVASAIRLQEENQSLDNRRRLKATERTLAAQMEDSPSLGYALGGQAVTLLDLMSAQTTGAAIFADDRWTRKGETPGEAQLDELVAWIRRQRRTARSLPIRCPHFSRRPRLTQASRAACSPCRYRLARESV